MRIYVASRSHHAPMWRTWRDHGAPIISTWIDLDEQGAIDDWPSFWAECTNEAILADCVIAYHEPGDDPWKGALIEIGAALGHANAVYLVGNPVGSWVNHPDVIPVASIDDALNKCGVEL